ncbi:uncharacterized protein VDAG_04211 [Verticillium dahliae VdLs.17]|uniref:Uncharacterized protein n=1 Tax=Verticillium dahliae (strain VdLs.17 / ATCC MYA-4575 / FGSC 10137) TaxID=498257 RepID=G2X317_VERDV|nr:uncharacterized protein VDAG_04211 [Verticillium dahliae VdLs.17]EGY22773.1 hypothetical protein VDAG_04211 [Verticillium dahliae VdLs.17]
MCVPSKPGHAASFGGYGASPPSDGEEWAFGASHVSVTLEIA